MGRFYNATPALALVDRRRWHTVAQRASADQRGQPVLDGRRLPAAQHQRLRTLARLLVPRRTVSRRLRHAQTHLLSVHGRRAARLARSLSRSSVIRRCVGAQDAGNRTPT